jgi:hypothetical protein
MRAIIRMGLLGLMLLSSASARISSSPIAELIASSDEIVIAKVLELLPTSSAKGDLVYASASVEKTLKGKLSGSFMFVASAGWVCDTSGAIKDERALFFLGHADSGMYYIQMAGRGRMPFRQVDGKTYVTLWNEVLLPEDAPLIAGPDARYAFIRSVELGHIEGLIGRQGRGYVGKGREGSLEVR